MKSGFSRSYLERIYDTGTRRRDVFWRHDVDFSLDAALKMAHFEAERGVSGTYYLFLSSENPFYSTENAKSTADELRSLGHRYGDHVDERRIGRKEHLTGLVSFHCPTSDVVWNDFHGFESAYASKWENCYSADSNGQFKTDPIRLLTECKKPVQVNLHPEWWFEPGWYHDVNNDVYEAFFYCKKPNFSDSRYGRPVRSGRRAVWAFDPRGWSPHTALWVSPEDYAAVMRRGYALIDGQKAVPFMPDCDEDLGFLRLTFISGSYELPEGREEPPDVRKMKK